MVGTETGRPWLGLSPEMKGVALMVLGVAFISANDAIAKYLTERLPIGEVVFLRQLTGLGLIIPYALATSGWTAFRIIDRRSQSIRAVAFVATSVLMVASLAHLPLAIAAAIAFSGPIWIAVLAGPVLGEVVTARRLIAILVGFAGVLILMRPGGPSFTWALLLPVATALATAIRDLMTRRLAATDSSISILIWSALLSLVLSGASLPFGWVTPSGADWGWLALAGVFNSAAHFSMISAYRYAGASALSPFRYTSLIWAIALGFLVWGHLPDGWSLVGTAVIVTAAALSTERRARGKAKA